MRRVNHDKGQRRAELFDDFISRLVAAMYPGRTMLRNIGLVTALGGGKPLSLSVDFLVATDEGEVLIETKAPYSGGVSDAVRGALRHLSAVVEGLARAGGFSKAVLAVPVEMPEGLQPDVEAAAEAVAQKGVQLEIWDARKLHDLAKQYLDVDILLFDIDNLQQVVDGGRIYSASERLPVGPRRDVIVLSADFCSFSKFVHASGADDDLVASIMGRFYRETRHAIAENGGILDKYIGDGILCYWVGEDSAAKLETCTKRLIGISINLAEEWQDQIDLAVEPKGLRAGAAIGSVLFVAENPGGAPVHAIGDSINISARLQSAADPNSLVISNRLRARYFADRVDFQEVGTLPLKNIGDVVAWRKSFVESGGA
jgi:class 3 adenylate cyclase